MLPGPAVQTTDGTRLFKAFLFASIIIFLISIWTTPATSGWRGFTSADGLAGNHVTAMLEDRSGNLWFATETGGVSRFDGFTWSTFTQLDGLAGNGVASALEDASGTLWFGTFGSGVSRYDGSEWRTFTTADGLADDYVDVILQDRAGIYWFGTRRGLSRYDGSSWTTYTTTNGLPGEPVLSLLEDRSGDLWVGSYGGGVSRYDGVHWQNFTTADGLTSNNVAAMLEDSMGIWFSDMNNGVTRRTNNGVWRTYTTADGLGSNSVAAMLEDQRGHPWFCTIAGGVSSFDGVAWQTYTTSDGLASNSVSSILEDSSGNLWFGTVTSGVSRYDRSGWRTFTTADGLGANVVASMLEDRIGRLWFGTQGGGISIYAGSVWRTYTTADGLGNNDVWCMVQDAGGRIWAGTSSNLSVYNGSWYAYPIRGGIGDRLITCAHEDTFGNLWFGAIGAGVTRYDGQTFSSIGAEEGLGDVAVSAILEDRTGRFWFGTATAPGEPGIGVKRFDGSAWRAFTTADGLASNDVSAMLEDRQGALWVGSYASWFWHIGYGVSRFDGGTWSAITSADGLASDEVWSMLEDREGNIWFGTSAGVSRYDGSTWRTFSPGNGLGGGAVRCILEDRFGNLWFGTEGGASRYEPDRIAPQTTFLRVPPTLTSERNQDAAFGTFAETDPIEFSYRLDAGPWSPWSPVNGWLAGGLSDGTHVLEVRSRDFLHNVDPTPARAQFEIDATPPAPVISSPAFGQSVRQLVVVTGKTEDARFLADSVWVRPAGAISWLRPIATLLASSVSPVAEGALAEWDTSSFPDGNYEIRVSVTDSLGLVGISQVTVVVDNHFPFAVETTPARIGAKSGGHLYTTNQELHLYFSPGAFDVDAVVSISPVTAKLDTLPSGAAQLLPSYDIAWSTPSLRKPALLEFLAGPASTAGDLAVYFSRGGTSWERLGGTVDRERVSLALTAPGRYAVFSDVLPPEGGVSLTGLSFIPRVFSPSGGFANDQVSIGFTLGRTAPVTVRIYNRAGRLVREVVSGQAMAAGANVVRWNGRDRAGVFVADGAYLVTVEAFGQTRRSVLAVVR